MMDFPMFAEALKKYERQLFTLVLSSFFFSSLASLIEKEMFGPDFMILTSVIAGIMGVAGILSSFHASLINVRESLDDLLLSDSGIPRLSITFGLMIAAILVYAFYYFAKNGSQLALLFLSLAQFLFFQAIAKSLLVIVKMDQQRRTWEAMSQQERDAWTAAHQKKIQHLENLERIGSETEEIAHEVSRIVQESDEDDKRMRRSMRWDRLHALSLRFRKAIAGRRLLTRWERLDDDSLKESAQKLIDSVFEDDIERILAGNVSATPIEDTNMSVYNQRGYLYVVLDTPTVTSAVVVKLIHDLTPIKEASKDEFERVIVIVPLSALISFEAAKHFSDNGIRVMRPRNTGKSVEQT